MPDPTPPQRPGIALAVLALVVAQVLVFHRFVPNLGGYASLAETFLPWLGLPVMVLGVLVLRRSSRLAALAVTSAALVWALTFLPSIVPQNGTGPATFTVASENVRADNPRAGEVAAALAATGADVVAVQELDTASRDAVAAALNPTHPFAVVVGTVGLWSSRPILESATLDLGLGWDRALWADIDTDAGRTRVYTVHLDSIRPGRESARDAMLAELGETLDRDVTPRIVVVGDFNSATTDRAFARFAESVTDVNTSTFGLGFTWPSAFPVARLDHLLVRGYSPVSSTVLPANGSDHRGILVSLR
ncbi:MAG: endonuclease/exonuclease/phosphatase family protein [Cryobacterium sp.]